MVIQTRLMTVEEFEVFVDLPQNDDKLLEYIGGEIVAKLPNVYVSEIAQYIAFFLRLFLREHKLEGHITGEAGGYKVAGERYAPDVGYVSYDRQKELSKSGYNPIPPDLAVEVVSADRNQELDKLRIKITNYLSVGTVVWVVKPDDNQIEVHESGKAVIIYRHADTLEASSILPDFKLKLSDIFGEIQSS